MSIKSMMSSNHLILCHPFLLLPSIFPSIRVFSNESALCIRWPKYWSFSFNISPSSEHPGLISFRMDWLDLLAVDNSNSKIQPRPRSHFLDWGSSMLFEFSMIPNSVLWALASTLYKPTFLYKVA